VSQCSNSPFPNSRISHCVRTNHAIECLVLRWKSADKSVTPYQYDTSVRGEEIEAVGSTATSRNGTGTGSNHGFAITQVAMV
jgi:hypothetical protein